MITAFLASRRVRAFARHRLGLVGLAIVVTFTLVAVLAPWIAPHDPTTQRIATARLQPPSAQYLMGTDELGRDIFSRVVHGARISMRIGLIAEGIALLIGIVLAVIAHRSTQANASTPAPSMTDTASDPVLVPQA